jgi:hypothetical protein
VRYLLTRRLPVPESILLIESGSRYLWESTIAGIRGTWGDRIFIDLVTPFPGLPEGFAPHNTRVYRVTDYRGSEGRQRLFHELAQNRYSIVGMICSGEPLMTKWKWALALKLPAKVFILNENGDYFWLDRFHLPQIRGFVLFRAGLAGAGAVRTLARLALFPFTLLYLLLYASAVHARRALRTKG